MDIEEDELTSSLIGRTSVKENRSGRNSTAHQDSDRLELPNNFDSIVSQIERKFRGSESRADCLVDLTNLRVSKDKIYQPVLQTTTDTRHKIVGPLSSPSDFRREIQVPNYNQAMENRKAEGGRHSMPVQTSREAHTVQYMTPQYRQGTTNALISYEAPSTSQIYDKEYQFLCINQLCKELSKQCDQASILRKHLQEKIQKTLGLAVLPSPGSQSLMPFVFCDDCGDFNISFLFDSPPNTPWAAIARQYFGVEALQMQKKLYELICQEPPVALRPQHKNLAMDFRYKGNQLNSVFDELEEDDDSLATDSQESRDSIADDFGFIRPPSRSLMAQNGRGGFTRTTQERQAILPELSTRAARLAPAQGTSGTLRLDQAINFLHTRKRPRGSGDGLLLPPEDEDDSSDSYYEEKSDSDRIDGLSSSSEEGSPVVAKKKSAPRKLSVRVRHSTDYDSVGKDVPVTSTPMNRKSLPLQRKAKVAKTAKGVLSEPPNKKARGRLQKNEEKLVCGEDGQAVTKPAAKANPAQKEEAVAFSVKSVSKKKPTKKTLKATTAIDSVATSGTSAKKSKASGKRATAKKTPVASSTPKPVENILGDSLQQPSEPASSTPKLVENILGDSLEQPSELVKGKKKVTAKKSLPTSHQDSFITESAMTVSNPGPKGGTGKKSTRSELNRLSIEMNDSVDASLPSARRKSTRSSTPRNVQPPVRFDELMS